MDVTVLSVASRAVLDACAGLGLDRRALAEAAGVDLDRLAEPDARIPAAQADAIWTAAAAASQDPSLAVRAAEALPFGAYRVIDFLTANAPTLGHALTRIAAYFPIIDPRGRIRCIGELASGALEAGADHAIEFETADGGPMPRAAVEYTFAALVLRSRAGLGVDWRPRAVELHGPPASAEQTAELARILGVAPRFGAATNRMWIAASDWSRPSEARDPILFEILDHHAALLLTSVADVSKVSGDASAEPEPALVPELRGAVDALLREGDSPVLERVAAQLGVSGRTLQRRLDDHGLRFGELVDAVKAEHAKAYLHDRDLALCEVAFLLGFADQSAFTRAFKRWTGQTPGRFRRGVDRGGSSG